VLLTVLMAVAVCSFVNEVFIISRVMLSMCVCDNEWKLVVVVC